MSDVGLARALRGTRLHANASRVTGGVYTSPMSPEQWNDEELTVKSDVCAYAVMLNEMVTWARPGVTKRLMTVSGKRSARASGLNP